MSVLRAPAKLTWYLEVTGRRTNGMHEIASEMTTIDLVDLVEVEADGDSLRVEGPCAASVPIDATNIVARALALVGRRCSVVVHKEIPVGGGLGGGSADAGAILRWAGGVTNDEALLLGGDVPFCQVGGRAVVSGVGEVVEPLDFVARDVTLFLPDFSVDTAACYRAYDVRYDAGWRPRGRNHLEEPAGDVEPRLVETLEWLRGEYGDVQLAGSGSTMFLDGHVGAAMVRDVRGPAGPIQLYQTTTTPS